MRAVRWPLVAALGVMALLLSHCGGGGDATGSPNLAVKTAQMNGAQVVPAVTTAGVATGAFTIDLNSGAISGTVSTINIDPTGMSIQEGAVGTSSTASIITLSKGSNGMWEVPSGATLTSSQLDSLKNGNLYVSAATTANPNGEIRGQIGRKVFFATLTGAQETPPTTSTATGTGVFVFDPETGTMSGTVTTTGVSGVASHMHIAAIGQSAAPAIPFTGGPATFTMPPTVLTADQVNSLGLGNFYTNVHSSANPGGEIRGQVYIPVRMANLTGSQETPPNTSAATGQGTLMVNPFNRSIAGLETFQGVANPTDSHIHSSAGAGVAGGIVIRGTVTLGNPGKLLVASSTPLSDALLVSFMQGNLYYNVHSQQFPSGEIRGQLSITP